MDLSLLFATIIIELVIIVGVSCCLKFASSHGKNDFLTSSRGMPMIAVAATQALTALGGGHILGMPAASWSFGVAAYWYVIGSGFMMIILMVFTGPWVRRFGFTTINQLFERMFDKKVAIVVAGIGAGTIWGILTLETQGVGAVIAGLSGCTLQIGCIIGGVIGVLYVIFGGMKEVGWVNVINAAFMYIGAFIGIFYLGTALPDGWAGVNDYYVSGGNEWMLSITATSDVWRVYIIGTVISMLFYVSIGPQAAQISASAKNVNAIKKAVWIAIPINTTFGGLMIAFGMAAHSIPEFAQAGPIMGTFNMLINLLPGWLVAWLMAAFAAAMLSTMAVQILAISTVFIKDIYCAYYKTNATKEQEVRYVRVAILIFAVGGVALSTLLPPVNAAIVWLFAWLLPAFWMFTFGMFWKRSAKAALWTLIICGIANTVWSFSPLPKMCHLEGNNNSIVMAAFAFLVGIILIALDKNAKPSFLKMYKENRKSVIAADMQ